MNRSEVGAGPKGTAPTNPTDAEISKLFKDFLGSDSLILTLSRFPSALEFLIETGTDIAYDDVKGDIFVVVEFVVKILSHNIGPRLQNFLSIDYRRVKELLLGRAGSGQKVAS